MKKVIAVIVLVLLWCNEVHALTQQEAIDKLSGRKLDLVEGVYISGRGMFAIWRVSEGSYTINTIRHTDFRSGEVQSYISGSHQDYFGSTTAFTNKIFGGVKRLKCSIKVFVHLKEIYFDTTCKEGSFSGEAKRVWPLDYYAYNKKFDKKKVNKTKNSNSCVDNIDFSVEYGNNKTWLHYEFRNISNKSIIIFDFGIKSTSDHFMKKSSDEVKIYIKPFEIGRWTMAVGNLNLNVVDRYVYNCEFGSKPTSKTTKKTRPKR